jgi:hypothetical protein
MAIDWAKIKELKSLLYVGSDPIVCKFLDEGTKVDVFEFRFQVECNGEEQTLVTKSGRMLNQMSEFVPLTGKTLKLSKEQKTIGGKSDFFVEEISVENEKHGKKSKK